MVRLRKTDLLGLIGIALLVAWTPAYYAQDPVEQGLTTGTAFSLPVPRDGEEVVYGLHIEEDDGPVQVIEDAVRVRFKAYDPTMFPFGATIRAQIIHRAADHNGTHMHYEHQGAQQTFWYAPTGRLVWQESEWTGGGHDGDSWNRKAHAGNTCHLDPLPLRTGETYRYVPSTLGVALGGFDEHWAPHPFCEDETIDVTPQTVNLAHRFGDDILYAHYALRSDRWYDHFSATSDGSDLRTCTSNPEGRPYLGISWNNYGSGHTPSDDLGVLPSVTLKGFNYACDVRLDPHAWNWISSDLPLIAGWRLQYFDVSGDNILRMELLAEHHESGNAQLRLDASERSPEQGQEAKARSHPLETDDAPLVHGRTLAEVHQAALDHADEEARAFIERADLVYFTWRADERTHTGPSSQIPQFDSPPPVTVDHDEWTLVYRASDGMLRLFVIRLQSPTPMAPNVPVFFDRCDDQPELWGCQRVSQGPIRAVSPSSILTPPVPWAQATDDLLDPPSGLASNFQYDPLGLLHTSPRGEWSIEDHGRTYSTRTGWNLTDGSLVFAGASTPASGDAYQTTPITTPGATTERIEHVTTTVAWGGLLLIALSGIIRLVSALKTGTVWAPLIGLYAKIRKDAVLDNRHRDAIMDLVEQEPGLTPKELSERIYIGWGTTLHHVETLRRNGLITQLAEGGRRYLFPAAITDISERRRIAYRRNPDYAAFLHAVAGNPGAPLKEIAPLVPQRLTSVSRTGTRLASLGLVEKRKDGRTVRFYPIEPRTGP